MYSKSEQHVNEQLDTMIKFSYLSHEFVNTPFLNYVKKNYGWTALQFRAICILKREGRISMSMFAERLLITRQQATQLINSLVEHDLAIRDYSIENRRNVFIIPSEHAVELLIEAENAFAKSMLEYIGKLPSETSERMYLSMKEVTYILDKIQNGTLPPLECVY